jgi:hypothetical protein
MFQEKFSSVRYDTTKFLSIIRLPDTFWIHFVHENTSLKSLDKLK